MLNTLDYLAIEYFLERFLEQSNLPLNVASDVLSLLDRISKHITEKFGDMLEGDQPIETK